VRLLVTRSLRQHALSTAVTVCSAALATGLVLAVFSIKQQAQDAFTGGATAFDAVLGARGSQLQLVLNSVFHLETSPGNIPWSTYQAIAQDPRVRLAIPYAVGDNYRGFRIVGTTPELFERAAPSAGRRFAVRGRFFDPSAHEAVIGSVVAQRTGLREGATFHPYHGVAFSQTMQHAEQYTVVGVLAPTNTPADRVVWIPIEGVYRMSGHVLRGAGDVYTPQEGQGIPDEHQEVSAVLLQLHSPQAGFALDQQINKQGRVATLAWPIGRVMTELFDKLGWVNRILGLVAYLVMLVAGGSILASVYNSISERRRAIAILRALGARRRLIFAAIVSEATVIAGLGAVLGYGVYAALLSLAAVIVRGQTGVVLEVWQYHSSLLLAPLGMVAVGAVAGIVPAIRAYMTDVGDHLAPTS
jgi:putative ABC transport system permease protein